ncbi:right-handed parallel beta-helix repeat-containing protein [Natronorubrum tibetense]|uniref:Right handed beta helix domain-containing protein n=1 Tax=Natronorubrum tibetense GA33 TaxID=1114856 RepID=L9VSC5_9EURY|nr:right-handed parallel beta-helix repeat-containing protein [Natronorubrum tibetense]ELY39892.1 hypothetical protein C496_14481 [Natronorubrum tibetense GA33]
MKLSRRAAIVAGAAVATLTAGCQRQETTDDGPSDPEDSEDPEPEEDEDMTDGTSHHFNEDNELTSPIRIDDGDVSEKIDPETGDRIIKHEPSSETWGWKSDGAFVTNAVETDQVSVGEQNNVKRVNLDDGPEAVQDALSTIGSNGGGIVRTYGSGTYIWDKPVTIDHNNVELWGPGPAATITQGDEHDEIYILGIQGEENNRIENCAIRYVHVEGGRTENIDVDFANNSEVTHFISENSGDSDDAFAGNGDGVDTDYCDNIYIGHGITRNCRQSGIHVSMGTTNSTVENVWSFDDAHNPDGPGSGIDFRGDGVANNTVKGCKVFDSEDFGIADLSDGPNKIVDCFIDGTGRDGFRIQERGEARGIISRNAGRYGFNVDGAVNGKASNIHVIDPDDHGVWIVNADGFSLSQSSFAAGDSTGDGVRISSDDVELWSVDSEGFGSDFTCAGDRCKFDGVIDGGPLGGDDLSESSGAEEGNTALSDDSSAGDSYVLAVFDGSSWKYYDNTDIIAPSCIRSYRIAYFSFRCGTK